MLERSVQYELGVNETLHGSCSNGEEPRFKFMGDQQFAAGADFDFGSFVKLNGTTTIQHAAVWVIAFPRSGSSTTLSMIASPHQAEAFALFEPCHSGDKVS